MHERLRNVFAAFGAHDSRAGWVGRSSLACPSFRQHGALRAEGRGNFARHQSSHGRRSLVRPVGARRNVAQAGSTRGGCSLEGRRLPHHPGRHALSVPGVEHRARRRGRRHHAALAGEGRGGPGIGAVAGYGAMNSHLSTVAPNPSIEPTSFGRLRLPTTAAHFEC